MAIFFQIASLLCVVFQSVTTVSGLSFSLDVASDGDTMWKIKGDTVYLETGQRLRRGAVNRFLPDNFKYVNFDMTRGIWAVVPNQNRDCAMFGESLEWPSLEMDSEESQVHDNHDHDDDHHHKNTSSSTTTTSTTTEKPCDISASGSFQCNLRAQLLSSVAVRYNFGGNATIRITGGRRQPFEIYANNLQADNWEHFKVDHLEGRSMLLEAIVNGTGDYILIDRITVETLEPSTTPRPTRPPTRRTTTVSPPTDTPTTSHTSPAPSPTQTPAPASGQSGMMPTYSTNMSLVLLPILIYVWSLL